MCVQRGLTDFHFFLLSFLLPVIALVVAGAAGHVQVTDVYECVDVTVQIGDYSRDARNVRDSDLSQSNRAKATRQQKHTHTFSELL